MTSTDGLVLLNKPEGMTSFQSLNAVKRAVKGKKVGHAGTLDKFAKGLVIGLVGGFTRLNPYFSGLDKSYLGVVTLGVETATLDPQGEVVKEGAVPHNVDWNLLLSRFTGPQRQIPPRFSAIHVQGKRAYKRTLSGEDPLLPPRDITIHSLELVKWHPPHLTIRVKCSKGTYIRSLARDLGEALGSCAHLSFLVRETIGGFRLEDAVDPEKFDPAGDILSERGVFSHLNGIDLAEVRGDFLSAVGNGQPLKDDFFTAPLPKEGLWALFGENTFLGLAERRGGKFRYRMVKGRQG